MTRIHVCLMAMMFPWFLAASAEAQLAQDSLRVWIDTDVFSGGTVRVDPQGPGTETKGSVIGIGPNQMGNTQLLLPAATLGVGVGYVLRPQWLLGLRTGLGFDRIKIDDVEDKRKVLALSFMPNVTWVPRGEKAKLFVQFSPVLQYNHTKQGSSKDHLFVGCFSIGAGTFWFPSSTTSLDIGAFFEGRFGKLKEDASGTTSDVSDLRGILRVGISFWT